MRHLEDVVADNIRRLRTERGWSQAELATALFLVQLRQWSPSTVALVETGKQRADRLLDLAALCQVFGVPLTELITGDGAIDLQGGDSVQIATIRDCLAGNSPGVTNERLNSTNDPFELARIARNIGLTRAQLILACYDRLNRWDFNNLREEWADIPPGTSTRTAQAMRGHATRRILELVQRHVVADGVTAVEQSAMRKLRADIRKNPELRPVLESHGIYLGKPTRKETP